MVAYADYSASFLILIFLFFFSSWAHDSFLHFCINYRHMLFICLFYLFIFGCAGSSLLRGLSLVAVSRGYCLVVMCGLLVAMPSLVVEHGL